MTFAIDRRRMLTLMTSAMAAGAVFGANPARAAGLISAYAQALSAAAEDDAVLAGFYQDRNYVTVWTGDADVERRQALFAAFETAPAHGLPAERYDAAALRQKFTTAETEGDLGRLEVAMSRAYLSFVRDLSSGALVPSKIEGAIKREVVRPDPALVLIAAAQGDFVTYLNGLAPKAPEYARLMKEKFALEAVIADGGFGPTVNATSLGNGDSGAAVVELRDRLQALGYLERSFTETYNSNIAQAVQRFQLDYGLEADGVADKRTIAALNVDPVQRLKSVVVAMERLRWMGDVPHACAVYLGEPARFRRAGHRQRQGHL